MSDQESSWRSYIFHTHNNSIFTHLSYLASPSNYSMCDVHIHTAAHGYLEKSVLPSLLGQFLTELEFL